MPPTEKGGQVTQCGNKTECALLGFVQDIGRDYESVRKANPEESFFKVRFITRIVTVKFFVRFRIQKFQK